MAETAGKKIKIVLKKKNEDQSLPSDITNVLREKEAKEAKKQVTKSSENKSENRFQRHQQKPESAVKEVPVATPPVKEESPEKELSESKEKFQELYREEIQKKVTSSSAPEETKPYRERDHREQTAIQEKQEKKEVLPDREKQVIIAETERDEPAERIDWTEKTDKTEKEDKLEKADKVEKVEIEDRKQKKPAKKFYHHKSATDEEILPVQENRNKKQQKEQEHERIFNKKEQQKKKEQPKPSAPAVPKEITITENIQVSELAKKLNIKPSELIAKLMKLGVMATINQTLDADTAIIVASEFGADVKVVSLYEETLIKEEEDREEDRVPRPPVVTIMGHVDHGKTKLLDTIRKSNVAEKEAGAITQHIGAYQVTTPKGKITFLDTPGHEAFTSMRARGASVTDIVVLVVAADDGVKEQTVEAIHHAQAANVPIIVAINKIDLPTADPEKVKKELIQYGLQPEEWGGDTIYCEISAKNNIGIDNLLDMILLQAEMMELKANPKVRPVGRVIESKKDPGKGPVATVLVQKGTLREGDPFVVGVYAGKVRAMFDDYGRRIYEAGPSTPVEIIGIDDVPEPGDPFHVVESEKEAREIAAKRQYYKQISQAKTKQPSWKDLDIWTKEHKELKVIIKADVHGSVEAIRDGLLKLSTDEVKVNVIYAAAGPITESDVNLAIASNALIVSFQVRATAKAQEIAEQNNVEIKYYSIIYNLLEDMEKALKGLLQPKTEEVVTGEAEVRQVFRISKVGNVAGCMVRKGKINRNERIRLIRDGVVIYEGEVLQLKRFKDDVVEVAEGFECGISIKGYNDIKEGDIIEFYKIVEVSPAKT